MAQGPLAEGDDKDNSDKRVGAAKSLRRAYYVLTRGL